MVPGLELVAGYLIAWTVRKIRRVGGKADGEVDRVLDAGMEKLHDLVSSRLGPDPALAQLERDASAGIDSERTKRRVHDAVEQAVEDDPAFAEQLGVVLRELAEPAGRKGGASIAVNTGGVIQSNITGIAVANTGSAGSFSVDEAELRP